MARRRRRSPARFPMTEPIDEADAVNELTPIGYPLLGTTMVAVDERRRPLEVGEPGELLVGGVQVAPGYLEGPRAHRSELRHRLGW